MVNPAFYEYREPDKLQPLLRALLFGFFVLFLAGTIGSSIAANGLGCPKWLPINLPIGSHCLAAPPAGAMWSLQYRVLPNLRTRANLRRWPAAVRARFYRELDVTWIAYAVGLAIAFAGAMVILVRSRGKDPRPTHKGTRFWATDEQVFGTGLAVNYRPPLTRRLGRKGKR